MRAEGAYDVMVMSPQINWGGNWHNLKLQLKLCVSLVTGDSLSFCSPLSSLKVFS